MSKDNAKEGESRLNHGHHSDATHAMAQYGCLVKMVSTN